MAASTSAKTLDITIEFGGGTEFLTSTKKIKKHVLKVPSLVADGVTGAGNTNGAENESAAITAPNAEIEINEYAETNGSDPKVSDTLHATTMRDLVKIVLKELITERHSMLVEPDGSIRPGILILINDADWELEGEMEYELQDKDHICFISTLHGG